MPRQSERTQRTSKSRRNNVKPSAKRREQTFDSSDRDSSSEEEKPRHREEEISSTEVKTLTNNIVRYIMNFSATKLPILRANILKSVNMSVKNFPKVFSEVVEVLRFVYGLEAGEVEMQKKKVIIIISARKFNVPASLMPEQRHETSLLFKVLSYIFMKGGDIQEAHVFQFLDNLDIKDAETHQTYGDVGKTIREKFTRQLYLKRLKIETEGSNEVQIHLQWGPRAEKEFDKKDVLEAVSKIMDKSPMSFVNQHHEATLIRDGLELMSE